MLETAACEQFALHDQLVHHGLVGRTVLALLLAVEADDGEPREDRHMRIIGAVLVDHVRDGRILVMPFRR